MNSMRLIEKEDENDAAEVTWEDQQKISTFSKLNTRMRSIEEKMQSLKHEKEALDDLSSDLDMVLDEEEPILYKIGEAFLHMPLPRAVKRLEHDQKVLDEEISMLATSSDTCEKLMKDLKVQLYAKFGSAINLDE